jgi:hypothetical protein
VWRPLSYPPCGQRAARRSGVQSDEKVIGTGTCTAGGSQEGPRWKDSGCL